MTLESDGKTAKPKSAALADNQNKHDSLSHTRRRSKSVSEASASASNSWNCSKCEKDFLNIKYKLATCSICESHYCTPCIEMSDKQYKALQTLKRDDILWLCGACLINVNENKGRNHHSLEITNLRAELDKKIESLENKMDALNNSISQTVTSSVASSVANSFASSVNKSNADLTKTFAEVLVGTKNNDETVQTQVKEKGVTGMINDIVYNQRLAQNQEEREKEEREKKYCDI